MASIPDMSAHGQLTINDIYGTGAWLTYALIAACFASLLVPLLVVLLVFSTNDLRRSLIFYLNVLALFMGIGEGVTLAYLNVYNIFFPEGNNSTIPGPVLSWLLFSFWSPMLVEGILYLRLWAVFPPTLVSRNTRVVILGIPVLSKGARCAVLGYATFEWVRSASMIGTFLAGLQFWPMARVVWCLQLFDNIYMSTLFIYQLRSQMNTGPILGLKLNSFTDRARTLFMISISNFVVPCIFCTAQIVIASIDIQATNLSLFLFSTYLAVANNYVTILGVVFATVWSAGSRWMEHGGDSNDLGQLSQPVSIPSWLVSRNDDAGKVEAAKQSRSQSPSSSFHCKDHTTGQSPVCLGREEDLERPRETLFDNLDLEKQAYGGDSGPLPPPFRPQNKRHGFVWSGTLVQTEPPNPPLCHCLRRKADALVDAVGV